MTAPLLTIASGNPKKVSEIESMLGPLPIGVKRQPEGLSIEETGSSYLENALLKAQTTAKLTNTWAIADDSGLEVDALNGAPGIYSARFAINNEEKLKKLLGELKNNPYRSARFCSVMVLCDPQGNHIHDSEGICWGEILKKPAYPEGEFESIFWVREANCTYGQLSQEQLTRLGSRGKAARAMSPYLLKALNLN
ncbi:MULTISPECIES: non-canonical purine NTP pyrophosphatase [Prochlorococcus]|uniref:Xanthosine triphosphate pyrophosphatase n=1 Tax=Prochlorococcus marinus (strain SARG / CCMP1375 / SS120) TaxID=167539 RepID=Q7VD34_PROMA|nr:MULTISPECIES: non-canonical purine NTP pyrophosphatase [Prochlorococcus]AAP99594.1 Xanthosine triphosphate pyrophosphatase [Prochlorococcus marinus subsp. marinus str. CCMP1375]KGG11136.1 Nucleoside 5-triphosphatasee RdgB [Prochlorococcus marinus str. LG]KGG21474.1 Nucleoside 5-triphosphatasee RdgB [Prochlorococcus marinus str. SS2]KGG23181.1 Nucleoside 5-triphosphatasee RdgB [Prochlorococcus marinus str. SS35]KGG33892.1 Nucleoside 5-triphosphatasee RdgB [Prochlorococcus marinus str. SS51]